LGWCVHDADPYFIEPEDASGRSRLTLYGGHTEGLSHVSDGAHVLVWGGAWDDRSHEYDGGHMPDWWFRSDSEFEVTANPTHWMPLPPPPAASVSMGTSRKASEPKAAVEAVNAELLECLKGLLPFVRDLDDCGPRDEGWQSDALAGLIASADAAISTATRNSGDEG